MSHKGAIQGPAWILKLFGTPSTFPFLEWECLLPMNLMLYTACFQKWPVRRQNKNLNYMGRLGSVPRILVMLGCRRATGISSGWEGEVPKDMH